VTASAPTPPARPILALTQGDPAGIGPEILLKLFLEPAAAFPWQPLLVAERAALEALRPSLPGVPWERLVYLPGAPATRSDLPVYPDGGIPVLDPVGERRSLALGSSGPADAAGAMASRQENMRSPFAVQEPQREHGESDDGPDGRVHAVHEGQAGGEHDHAGDGGEAGLEQDRGEDDRGVVNAGAPGGDDARHGDPVTLRPPAFELGQDLPHRGRS